MNAPQPPPDLIRRVLTDAPDLEVIVSMVKMPPNMALPPHHHPGEEFAVVLDGEFIFNAEGEDQVIGRAGDTAHVDHSQVHTVRTGAEGGTTVLFRVHRTGEPERVLAEVPDA